jgi:hypothetical protein
MPKHIMLDRRKEGLIVMANYDLPEPPIPGLMESSSFNLEDPESRDLLAAKLSLATLIPQIVTLLRARPAKRITDFVVRPSLAKSPEQVEAEALELKLFGRIIYMRSLIKRCLAEYDLDDPDQYIALFMSTLITAFQEEGVGIVWQE